MEAKGPKVLQGGKTEGFSVPFPCSLPGRKASVLEIVCVCVCVCGGGDFLPPPFQNNAIIIRLDNLRVLFGEKGACFLFVRLF